MIFLLFLSDVNECQGKRHNCDVNAWCTNTAGSYKCFCKKGYEGDGTTCEKIGTISFLKYFGKRISLWRFGKAREVQHPGSKGAANIENTKFNTMGSRLGYSQTFPSKCKRANKTELRFGLFANWIAAFIIAKKCCEQSLGFYSVLALTHCPEKFEHVQNKVDESAWVDKSLNSLEIHGVLAIGFSPEFYYYYLICSKLSWFLGGGVPKLSHNHDRKRKDVSDGELSQLISAVALR